MNLFSLRPASMLLAGILVSAPCLAKADNYTFSFSGGGLSGSGVLTTSNAVVPGVPGAQQVTGISGTFTDSIAGFTGAITGLQPTSLPSNINPTGTFVPPGDAAGFSFDNLLYPAGNSPAVCPPPGPGDPNPPYPFGGGLLDIYGLLFNVQGGYSVDLWSNGVIPNLGLTYGVGDSLNGVRIDGFGAPFSGTSVQVSIAPTPEPESLLLLVSSLPALLLVARKKLKAAKQFVS